MLIGSVAASIAKGSGPIDPIGIAFPRWVNKMSFGDRRGLIALSGTISMSPNIGALFNGLTNYYNDAYFTGGSIGGYIQMDFGDDWQYIDGYLPMMAVNNSSNGFWKLCASHDNITYVDITDPFEWNGPVERWHLPSMASHPENLDFYQYYRFVLVSGTVSSSPWVTEINLHAYSQSGVDFRASDIAPSYDTLLGTGRRFGRMGAWVTVNQVGDPNELYDGDLNGPRFYFRGGGDLFDLHFDFFEPCLITEFTWRQDVNVTHGLWVWQAQTAPGVWTDFTAPFALGGVAQIVPTTAMPGDYYSRYRLSKQSGNSSSGPYLREIEFKIGYKAD